MEDIPVARRSVPATPKGPGLLGRLALGAGAMAIVAAGLALVFPQPLRRLLAPPPVAGLTARPGADGRLLGHFPYPEAPASALVSVGPGQRLRRDAAEALEAMRRAAAADGIELELLSAFRSQDLQKTIFFDVKSERNQKAVERAQVSAPPGFSEHSTGYAVDLGDARMPHTHLSPSFDQTEAFAWLEKHAARHHFILSFPPDNRQGVSYEPWHWRFEGSGEALQLFEPAQRLAR
ncbi:M15 family metallopeptidase [Aphanothece microscopica]|uniref:M15 family metallopeptidase n=1 Tax=Aphanothece microscopica TaxID=1049561 RepID=UPI003CE50E28